MKRISGPNAAFSVQRRVGLSFIKRRFKPEKGFQRLTQVKLEKIVTNPKETISKIGTKTSQTPPCNHLTLTKAKIPKIKQSLQRHTSVYTRL